MSKPRKKSGEKLSEAMTLVDRISDLPDSLLCRILSFLSTEQAVATSVLSKRWEFLWTYVDILEFDYDNDYHPNDTDPKKMQFSQFVHRVFQLHRAPVIKRMSLYCMDSGCNEYDVVTWIRTAVSRNVETLDLLVDCNAKLSICLFQSKTLVDLNITNGDMTNMNIPTAPFLPNLKKLYLDELIFTSDTLKSFISGCSILEDLILCNDELVEPCYISSATLKTFSLHCTQCVDKMKIVLYTPSLKFLKIWMYGYLELSVESSLPSLHKADISLNFGAIEYYSNSDPLLSDLQCLSHVTVLRLDYNGLTRPFKSDLHAQFHNLTKLEIRAPLYGLKLLRIFMEKSNNLEVIILEMGRIYQTETLEESGANWEEPEHVPNCLLSSLRTICIKGHRNEEEIGLMIKYVLENAKVLEDMEIHTDVDTYKSKFHMLQNISKFRRASETCEISFF